MFYFEMGLGPDIFLSEKADTQYSASYLGYLEVGYYVDKGR